MEKNGILCLFSMRRFHDIDILRTKKGKNLLSLIHWYNQLSFLSTFKNDFCKGLVGKIWYNIIFENFRPTSNQKTMLEVGPKKFIFLQADRM